MKSIEKIKAAVEKLGIAVNENQCSQFMSYYELLMKWNEFMNLTAITDFDEVVIKHFSDSLELVKVYDLGGSKKVMDLGTGAGFPGIPLKIVFPELNITLLDSLNKRVKFLNEVIENLGLQGIEAVHGRAEEYGKNKAYREQYDLCISRAVANLATLSEYCLPYVKTDGFFIPYKSGKIEDELAQSYQAIHILGGSVEKVEGFHLAGTDMERSLVVIKKVKHTPKQYPRNAGKPSKEPLR